MLMTPLVFVAEASEPVAEMLALYRQARDAPPLDIANALRSAAVHAEAIGDGLDFRGRHKQEHGAGIDEAADQPRTCDAVDLGP